MSAALYLARHRDKSSIKAVGIYIVLSYASRRALLYLPLCL